jgi:ABC-type transporter Mla MlaB component
VRASGLLRETAALDSADHVCWIDDDDDAFTEAAVRFLSAGLDRNERLLWIGDGAEERLQRSGGRLGAVDRLTDRGTLRILPATEAYTATGAFGPEEQLRFYSAEIRRALDDGYSGLRVVAEVTPVLAAGASPAGFLAWEHLCDDELISRGAGLAALCSYRRGEVPDDVLADAAARHPVVHCPPGTAPFRVWFEDGRLTVGGEVDAFSADRLARLLAAGHVEGPSVRLDLSGLTFVDLAGVRAVAAWARGLDPGPARLELSGASRLFRRMWALLGPAGLPEVSFPEGRP